MTSDRTVVVKRDILKDLSILLCSEVIDDPSKPDAVRDQARDLQFYLCDTLCYFGVRGDNHLRNAPTGMAIPQFYTNDLELLLADLYPNGLPDDLRSILIMMARQAARAVDDGLLTLDCRLALLHE